MPAPASTAIWAETMDPQDVIDFTVDCTGMLEENETIATFTVSLLAEASALGLTIGTGTYAPQLISGNRIRIWLSIASGFASNPAFNDTTPAILPFEVTINTSSTPARKKQRTVAVKVAQR